MPVKSLKGFELAFDTDMSVMVFNGMPQAVYPVPRPRGKDIYVSSVVGHAGSNGRSPRQAVATIAAGVALCTANVGDRVIVMEGHTETVSAATALGIAGIDIVGLGRGRRRPTITFDTITSAGYTIAVDNVAFFNIIFVANFLSIVAPITLSTAKGFRAVACKFKDTSSILNFLNCVKSTGAANTVDDLHLENCAWNGLGTTSVVSFLTTANDIDGLRLLANHVKLARTATAAVLATVSAGVLTDLIARDNIAISQQVADTGGGFINVGGTTSTGIVKDNVLGDLSTTDLFMTTTVGLTFADNKKTGVISASAYLLPAADS